MNLWRQLTRGVRNLTNRARADGEIDEEVEHYLDELTAMFQARGLPPEEARRAARLELGSVAAVRQRVRGYGWERLVDTTAADLRYAIRRLRRSPVFTFVGALTLALGIGASTAIFSAVNPVLFQPLPYLDAERLLIIWDGQSGATIDVTFGTYRELKERSRSFESIAVMRPLQATLTGVAEPERLDGQYVSADYFRTLGVRPALGRDFQESDDQPNAPFVVLISHALWHRRFGGSSSIVGSQIAFNEVPVTVIGVLPSGFENVLNPSAEIWSPLQYDRSLPLNGREWGHHLRMIGRLSPAASLDQARLELDAVARTPLKEFPRPAWASLRNGFFSSRLQDDLTRDVRPGPVRRSGRGHPAPHNRLRERDEPAPGSGRRAAYRAGTACRVGGLQMAAHPPIARGVSPARGPWWCLWDRNGARGCGCHVASDSLRVAAGRRDRR